MLDFLCAAPCCSASTCTTGRRPPNCTRHPRQPGSRTPHPERCRAVGRTGRRCVSSEVYLERVHPAEQFAVIDRSEIVVLMWGGAGVFLPFMRPNTTAAILAILFSTKFFHDFFSGFAVASVVYSRSRSVLIVNEDSGRLRFPTAVKYAGNVSNTTLGRLASLADLAGRAGDLYDAQTRHLRN